MKGIKKQTTRGLYIPNGATDGIVPNPLFTYNKGFLKNVMLFFTIFLVLDYLFYD